MKHFRLLQLLITIGLILAVAGGTSGTIEPNGTVKVPGTSKAGIVLYILAYVGIVLVYFISIVRIAIVPKQENRVPVAITFALPLVLVRIVYSACTVFLHSHLLRIVNGSIAVRVAMAVVEEFIVVAIYLALGFLVTKIDAREQGPIAGRPWKARRGGGGKLSKNVPMGVREEQRTYGLHSERR